MVYMWALVFSITHLYFQLDWWASRLAPASANNRTVSRDIFLALQSIEILVFPRPTGYMLTSLGFTLLIKEYSLNSSKFLKSWIWSSYFSNFDISWFHFIKSSLNSSKSLKSWIWTSYFSNFDIFRFRFMKSKNTLKISLNSWSLGFEPVISQTLPVDL